MQKILLLLLSFTLAGGILEYRVVGDEMVVLNKNLNRTINLKINNKKQSSSKEFSAFSTSIKQIVSEEILPVELHFLSVKSSASGEPPNLVAPLMINPKPIVAIIDTGFDVNNTQLRPYLRINSREIPDNNIDDDENGYIDDYYGVNIINQDGDIQDGHGHGTNMGSMVAINSRGAIELLIVKAFDDNGNSNQFLMAEAINYAVDNGARIINCSFGYAYYNEVLRIAVENALEAGVTIVASAGNLSAEIILYPSGFEGVIAVSGLNKSDCLGYFSNYGSHIQVSSVGLNVDCYGLGNSLNSITGTSISCAYIAGLSGYYLAKTGNSPQNLIHEHSIDIIDPLNNGLTYVGWDKYSGYGKLDTLSVYALTGEESLISNQLLNYPDPVRNLTTQFGFNSEGSSSAILSIYNLKGKLLFTESINGLTNGYNKLTYSCIDNNGRYLANDSYLAVIKLSNNKILKRFFSVLN